jgi:Cys-rich repeat protein
MVNDACADHICLEFNSACSRLCVDDSDCSTDASFVCAAFDLRAYCVQACATDADCAEGEVCSLVPNAGEDRYDWVCSNPRGEVLTGNTPEGGDCSTGGDCEKALCLTYTYDGVASYYCTGTCQSEADCPDSVPVCGTVNLSLLGGGQQQTNGCLPSTAAP